MPYPKFWTQEKLDKLKSLYDSGLSMREVGLHFNKSVWSINSVMKRHGFVCRKHNETRKIQFLHSPLSFNEKIILTSQEEKLKTSGLMLYWAEGGKRNCHGIDFANSDPDMISLFIHFLRTVYRVNESRFRIYLYTYPTLPIKRLIQFWSQLTQIPPNQFSQPYVRTNGGHVHDKMRYGLIHIRYADTRLLQKLMAEIELIKSWDGRVDKYTTL